MIVKIQQKGHNIRNILKFLNYLIQECLIAYPKGGSDSIVLAKVC